jgi:AcrR family transcriptional regulator
MEATMAPRAYRLGRRAESADDTRRRIVVATRALHVEQGVADTTVKQIARRADVSVGTVYHHFPSYDDVIRACGQLTFAIVRPPTDAIFAGCRSTRARIDRLTHELFACYERFPDLESTRCDRRKLPVLDQEMAKFDHHLAALVRQAVAPAGERIQRMARALTDVGVCRALTSQGLSTSEAADQIAGLLALWVRRG